MPQQLPYTRPKEITWNHVNYQNGIKSESKNPCANIQTDYQHDTCAIISVDAEKTTNSTEKRELTEEETMHHRRYPQAQGDPGEVSIQIPKFDAGSETPSKCAKWG